jgi:integrase
VPASVERSTERPTPTPEQVWELADAIEPRFRAMVLTAAFCGLRFGELAGLGREHVNLLHRTITVDRQLIERAGGRREFGPPKSDAGRRVIAIPPPLVPELEHHLGQYAGETLVFVGERGAPLARGNWHPRWRAAVDAVDDLPAGVRFHDLRHLSATLAAISGATTKELMRRLGHASPAAALRYQHATDDRDAEIAALLGNLLSGGRKGQAETG